MIQTVVKRDGRVVGFNEEKIIAAGIDAFPAVCASPRVCCGKSAQSAVTIAQCSVDKGFDFDAGNVFFDTFNFFQRRFSGQNDAFEPEIAQGFDALFF